MKQRRQRAYEELNNLSFHIPGAIGKERENFMLNLDESAGSGDIKCINFDDGLFMVEFNLNVIVDTYLPLLSQNDQAIYFVYCFKGNSFYATEHNNHFVKLDELQTAIVRSGKDFSGGLVLKANSDIRLNLLRVDTDTYFTKHAENPTFIAQKLKSFLLDLNRKHNLVHIGQLNFEIADYIKKMGKARYVDTLSELLYYEGLCVLILASHIEQYRKETNGKVNSTKLIKREIQKIMDLASKIGEDPQRQYSVESLSKNSGLAAAKLQEGFKFLYQRTVADYIRNARLEMAERLLLETDLNISEVVYSVGLTSRSYFCKIFKQKFKCNPKSYKNKNNILVSSF